MAFDRALFSPAAAPVPPLARSQVHVFMMNGLDVLETGRMNRLRDRLVCAGFPRVYTGQRADQNWYTRELRRVVVDEPAARIVLVGYGAAAAPVYNLAYAAQLDGLPVDAVVLLDPVGLNGDLTYGLKAHSVVVRSHRWTGASDLISHEVVEGQGVGHPTLPTHPVTVDTLLRVLVASAGEVSLEPPDSLPFLPLTDHPDPAPRPFFRQPKPNSKAEED
jgi:hypothetical protein